MSFELSLNIDKSILNNNCNYCTNDMQLGRSEVWKKIASWNLNSDDSLKANFIFVLKKIFTILDAVGISRCFYTKGGFQTQLEAYEFYQLGSARNIAAREKIVEAMAGEEIYKKIACVNLKETESELFIGLEENNFQNGEWIVRGKDIEAREFLGIRLVDSTGRLCIATAHQLYPESYMRYEELDGSSWALNFRVYSESLADAAPSFLPLSMNIGNIEEIAEFISSVRQLKHPNFFVAPKL